MKKYFAPLQYCAIAFAVIVQMLILQNVCHASTKTWIATTTFNWNTNANWSPSGVPGSSDDVIYSASSTQSSTINASVNVKSITIAATYSGTISQGSHSITVGSGGFSQASGTFAGGSSSITDNGAFTLTGGTFTSTSNTLQASSTVTINSPSFFSANSGTFLLSIASATITGSSTFYTLAFQNTGSGSNSTFTIATSTVLTVTNDLQVTNNNAYIKFSGGGSVYVQGNAEGGTSPVDSTGTALFYINGAGTQSISNTSGKTLSLPNMIITKTSGTLKFFNTIDLTGNFNNTSSYAITPGTSTVAFVLYASSTLPAIPTVNGTSTFYNLKFNSAGSGSSYSANINVPATTTLTVNGDLTIGTNHSYIEFDSAGSINVQGNINGGTSALRAPSGTVAFVMNGTSTTSTQMIDNTNGGGTSTLYLSNLTVNKTAGLVGVNGTNDPVIAGPLTIQKGELQISAGSTSSTAQQFEVDGMVTLNSSSSRLSNYPYVSSTLLLGTGLANNGGVVWFDGAGSGCGSAITANALIQSTSTGSQVTWSSSGGTFILRYANLEDQGSTETFTINLVNSTSSGNNDSHTFLFSNTDKLGASVQNMQPEFITNIDGTASTSTLNVSLNSSSVDFWPRAGDLILVAVSAQNQNISVPTDTAGNTYTLIASSTFKTSPTRELALFYAKNVSTTWPFSVTINGTHSLGSQALTANVTEVTGIAPSSTFDTSIINTDTSDSATTITSNNAVGTSNGEFYYGAATVNRARSLTSGVSWTSIDSLQNATGTQQSLFTEEYPVLTTANIPASWTTADSSTSYAAIEAIFHSPISNGYSTIGTLDSQTLDTVNASGTTLNSIVWGGTEPGNSQVKFQFAGSNASSGPWNFTGPDGTSNTYFSGSPDQPIPIVATVGSYLPFSGYRYYRYRITLSPQSDLQASPIIKRVGLNWSP